MCAGVLQDEIQELELPSEPMEKILVKLAELKHVRKFSISSSHPSNTQHFTLLLVLCSVTNLNFITTPPYIRNVDSIFNF